MLGGIGGEFMYRQRKRYRCFPEKDERRPAFDGELTGLERCDGFFHDCLDADALAKTFAHGGLRSRKGGEPLRQNSSSVLRSLPCGKPDARLPGPRSACFAADVASRRPALLPAPPRPQACRERDARMR